MRMPFLYLIKTNSMCKMAKKEQKAKTAAQEPAQTPAHSS